MIDAAAGLRAASDAFLLGFPALFSIVNPFSGAFIFSGVMQGRSRPQHERIARLVALYSLAVMMIALWAGSYVLAFFGISLAALRVAGGFVVALSGLELLRSPEVSEAQKQEQADTAGDAEGIAFFPLTIPFTTGPGTIAVAVALGAGHPRPLPGLIWFFLGMTGAAAALSLVIWVSYRSADQLSRWMGPTGTRTVSRLAAFLLLCIGVQILIIGVGDVLSPLLTARQFP